ncbi:MAG: NUDIX domain-containing protein [Chloroflexaceae bacterium]|nr:NUDIX domain-containing protein [Chloroflexaceae bacterium]
MSTDELLDVYSADGQPLGIARPKRDVHARGDWHRTFHCWLVYRDATGRDHMLVQRRASRKDVYPDKLDVTAAGHLQAGEGIEGGLRELWEELGIRATELNLHFIGQRTWIDDAEGIYHREFQDVYLLIKDAPLTAYTIDPVEVAGLADLLLDDLIDLFAGRRTQISGQMLFAGTSEPEEYPVTVADFIPTPNPYVLKVCQAARGLLAGETVQLIFPET